MDGGDREQPYRIFHQATVFSVLLLSALEALRLACTWLLLVASIFTITPYSFRRVGIPALQAIALYALVVVSSLFFVLTHPLLGLLQIPHACN
jgi:hypothetical protein